MSKGRSKASLKKPMKKSARLKKPIAGTHISFKRRFLETLPIIIGFSLLTFFLEYGGLFKSFESAVLDNWLRFKLNWISQASKQPSDISIVAITDEDYNNKDFFDGKSPLKPEKMQELIKAIMAGNPKVIGVDIDTSSWQESQPFNLPESPPIIWARDIEHDDDVNLLSAVPGREPLDLLHWGIARMPRDSDLVIRRYRRVYDTYQGTAPSFPLAVAWTARNEQFDENELSAIKETEWELNFSGPKDNFAQISASEILKAYNTLKAAKGQVQSAQDKLDELKNKIVLLGGFYEAGRDVHKTPLGYWAGVELMAQAVETEIKGGHPPPNEAWVILLGIVGSVGLVLLHNRLGWKWALPISLIAIVVLALLFSYFTTSTIAHWVHFTPILAAVLMRELYEHGKEFWQMHIKQLQDHNK